MPKLTPSCPYYVLDPSGRPTCNEECRDLVGEYGAGDRRVREVTIGGLVLRGRGLPVSAASGYMPYDATQTFLVDRQLPVANQRTSSLLLGLKASMSNFPFIGREASMGTMEKWAELERRQVPVDRVVRASILPIMSSLIGLTCSAPSIHEIDGVPTGISSDALDRLAGFALTGWSQALEASIEAEPTLADAWNRAARSLDPALIATRFEDLLRMNGGDIDTSSPSLEQVARLLKDVRWFYAMSLRFTDRVYGWLCRLLQDDLPRLLAWEAPTPSLFLAIAPEQSRGSDEVGIWLWERFTVTDLHEWQGTSLLLEWRHSMGTGTEVPTAVLAERATDLSVVASLALEKLGESPNSSPAIRPGLESAEFVGAAGRLLERGHIKEASEIFRGLVELRPGDGDALNNLGFCLLPLQPDEGLEVLQRASLFRLQSPLVNSANRVVALRLMGRDAEALQVVYEALSGIEGKPASGAYLWQMSPTGGLDLCQGAYPADHLRQARHELENPAN